ncbi:MAG: hypothetical protein ACE5FG_02845 [Myxococcota bacterium]
MVRLLSTAAALLVLSGSLPAQALDPNGPAPKVVISIASGGGTTLCDTGCSTCTVASGECVDVVENDLVLCRPLAAGLPITACDWELFFDGDANDIQLNNQLRALEVAPNGSLVFVALNDTVVPGIGAIKKTDVGLFTPQDIFRPYLGGGAYTAGAFKLYLNGDLTQQDETTKPWDSLEILPDGVCETNIDTASSTPLSCPIVGSLTSGSGSNGLGGIRFRNEDLLRCEPSGFAVNGTVEACSYSFFFDASNLNAATQGEGNGIGSDIEAIDFLSFDRVTMTGEMVFKKGSGTPPGFPSHTPARDLLLYTGTFGAGNCVPGGRPCAGDSDCPSGETCDTGSCSLDSAPCHTDLDCSGSGNLCHTTRFPAGSVSLFFDGTAVGLSGAGQKIEAFSVIPDADDDGLPDGLDNCPGVDNPPSLCSDGITPCPSGLSVECPSGEFCEQPDEDGDGVGDPCDKCNGRDDAVCFCGDGILDVPSEQCDLGSFNADPNDPNAPESPCSASCGVIGTCTGGSATSCTTAADCPPGEGCCGNGSLEGDPNQGTGEECDDGNSIDDDLCTNLCLANPTGAPLPPGCAELQGPNVVQALVNPMKLKSSDLDDVFEKWQTKGQFDLFDGVTFDPDSQQTAIVFSQGDVIFSAVLSPGAFTQDPPGKLRWKFKDREGDVPGAESWTIGKHIVKNSTRKRPLAQVRYTLRGRGDRLVPPLSIPVDPSGIGGSPPNGIRIRQSVLVGTTCATRVVTCERKSGGKQLRCLSLFGP